MSNIYSTLFISGVHSGPDPSPGLGIARSIKQSHPELKLIAKDYSLRSSGIHDPIFDDIQVMPAWSEMALEAHHNFIRTQLADMQALYISGLDAEIDWLSTLRLPSQLILNPSATALDKTQKPRISCASELGMAIPDFVPATASQADLHNLARRSGWRVWIKGKFHEAYPATNHREMISRLIQMQASWPIEDIFLQRSIQGIERSYTFAAYEGNLLGVAEVEKRSQTSAGKTWTAEVSMPTAGVIERITDFVNKTKWTGGCEIEFIRDRHGNDWLIDVNPRFPAYIHGVTISGLNLPGRLISAARGDSNKTQTTFGGQFTRVINEIPVRQNSQTPPITNAETSVVIAQKHPSFQPSLVNKRRKQESNSITTQRETNDKSSTSSLRPTTGARKRKSRKEDIDSLLRPIEDVLDSISSRIQITPALSIKTDPQGFLAESYLSRGWYAEAISPEELEWAKGFGFKPEGLILNGPTAALTALEEKKSVRYAFADSTASLASLVNSPAGISLGLRVRPSRVESRFGIDLTDYHSYISVLESIESLGESRRFAAHFHLPADQIGPSMWLDCFDEVITWSQAIAHQTGAQISAIDIGGGWHTDDFREILLPLLKNKIAPRVADLGHSTELIFEPGKAISSNLATYTANIVEVRDRSTRESIDVLIDCSIADLPMTQYYAHRIEHYRDEILLGTLLGGKDRVLGSICMETDILANGVKFPAPPKCGDKLIFNGAGAYNSSMAWPFARGKTRD